jgi:DNA-binding response OmpR family regulator
MVKILVVDDDIDATTLLKNFLTLDGYEPTTVNDSTAVIKKANSLNPDLFLLDLMMPVLDGFKLCRMLREIPKFAYTPVIIITALNDKDSRAVAFGAGANDYLTKPYQPDQLRKLIKDLIDKTK